MAQRPGNDALNYVRFYEDVDQRPRKLVSEFAATIVQIASPVMPKWTGI